MQYYAVCFRWFRCWAQRCNDTLTRIADTSSGHPHTTYILTCSLKALGTGHWILLNSVAWERDKTSLMRLSSIHAKSLTTNITSIAFILQFRKLWMVKLHYHNWIYGQLNMYFVACNKSSNEIKILAKFQQFFNSEAKILDQIWYIYIYISKFVYLQLRKCFCH